MGTTEFNDIDTDGSGTIDKDEAKTAARKLAAKLGETPPPDRQIENHLAEMDLNGDGTVSLKEYLTYHGMMRICMISYGIFQDTDVDNNGFVDRNELTALSTKIYEMEGALPPTHEEMEEFFNKLDESGDGKIDKDEFSMVMVPHIIETIENMMNT